MAGERCNLDKDEAEILKPSSSSSSPSPSSSSSSSPPPPLFLKPPQESPAQRPEASSTAAAAASAAATKAVEAAVSAAAAAAAAPKPDELQLPAAAASRSISRCSTCKKRVGLTGFRCRCGELFCGRHRYSDTHDCSFDYKALGREEIIKNNPVVRASKIIKI